MATITINDFAINIGDAEKCFKGDSKRRLQLPLLKRQEAEMKQRVFNNGKASNNTPLGKYRSKEWKKIRQENGRQTGYKDLEFNSDLRRDLTVGDNGGDIVLGFATDRSKLIAAVQEAQTSKEIWKPSKEEIGIIKDLAAQEIRKCLKKSFTR